MVQIKMVEYDSRWTHEFDSLASDLASCLGATALRIDHIGSTAVDGLAAKDIIDIQVTVSDTGDAKIEKKLIEAGYVFRSDIQFDKLTGYSSESCELRKKYFREKPGSRISHIHVRQHGRVNQEYPILFRDFLRNNSNVMRAYAEVKKELASRFGDDREAYYSIKDPYMDTIYEAAKLWSLHNDWRL
ncbi:GrpB family protein [Marinicella sp. S1101]|uniref:GrpB family protein n=1 Tax=Marinicella marina TaxID=2996016 RepID=UPI002260965D|nr:GrpB family protein [Marinicella marina]MCX7553386.1 GrpB family protein [Marinicella marina]MDJ1139118.1 GrpB family protein [Marinicella marina]